MNREELSKVFSGEELITAISVLEKYNMAKEYDMVTFSQGFLTPNLWMYFYNKLAASGDIQIFGGFEECERKMISFNNAYDSAFPLDIIKVTNKSKFRKLEHKDYLGSVLSLGIKRDKIGDLVLKENACYIAICDELTSFMKENLQTIGKNPCEVKKVQELIELPRVQYEEKVINIASLRVDSIVAALANVSRVDSVKLISSNKVLVNYSSNIEKSYEVKINSTITIRGKGKFIISEIIGTTKSDKLKIKIKKYI